LFTFYQIKAEVEEALTPRGEQNTAGEGIQALSNTAGSTTPRSEKNTAGVGAKAWSGTAGEWGGTVSNTTGEGRPDTAGGGAAANGRLNTAGGEAAERRLNTVGEGPNTAGAAAAEQMFTLPRVRLGEAAPVPSFKVLPLRSEYWPKKMVSFLDVLRRNPPN